MFDLIIAEHIFPMTEVFRDNWLHRSLIRKSGSGDWYTLNDMPFGFRDIENLVILQSWLNYNND